MTTQEYKDKYSADKLKTMLSVHNELLALYRKQGNQEQVTLMQNEIKAIEEAMGIATQEERSNRVNAPLTELEQQLIECLKTTTLGREGMVTDALLRDRRVADSLVEKGIVFHLEKSRLRTVQGNHLGLVGEEYPMTPEEFDDYRNSTESDSMSYTAFKQAKERGEIMSGQAVNDILYEALQIYSKEIEDEHLVNRMGIGAFINAKSDFNDMVVKRGLRGKNLLETILVEHMPDETMRLENPINKEWFNQILEKRLQFLQRQMATKV